MFLLIFGTLLSFIVFIASIIDLVRYRKSEKEKFLSPLSRFTGWFFLSVLFFLIPIHYFEFDAQTECYVGLGLSFENSINPALLSLLNTLQVFINDGSTETFESAAAFAQGIGGWLRQAYTFYGALLIVGAPILTFGNVLSMFKGFFHGIRFGFIKNKRVYIMSQLNNGSITLAKDILSQNGKTKPKSVIVFTDVNDEVNNELISSANAIKAIILKRKINELDLSRLKHIELFLIGEDENDNINRALAITKELNESKKEDHTQTIRVFAFAHNRANGCVIDSAEYKNLLSDKSIADDNISNETYSEPDFRLRRVDIVRQFVWNEVQQMGFFKGGCDRPLSILIVGLGTYGLEFFKTMSWFCYLYDRPLEINIIDKDPNIRSIAERNCPGLLTTADDIKNYSVEIFPDIDTETDSFAKLLNEAGARGKRLRRTTHAVIALGDDNTNTEAAIYLRELFDRVNPPAMYLSEALDEAMRNSADEEWKNSESVKLLSELFRSADKDITAQTSDELSRGIYQSIYLKRLFERVSLKKSIDDKWSNEFGNKFNLLQSLNESDGNCLDKLVDEAIPKINRIYPFDTVIALRELFDKLSPPDQSSRLREIFDKEEKPELLELLKEIEKPNPDDKPQESRSVSLLTELFKNANDEINKKNKEPERKIAYSVYLRLLFERVSIKTSDDDEWKNELSDVFKIPPKDKALESELNKQVSKLVDEAAPKTDIEPSKTVTALRKLIDRLSSTNQSSRPEGTLDLLDLLDNNSPESGSVSTLTELFTSADAKINKINRRIAYFIYLKLLFERVSLNASDNNKWENALANVFKISPEDMLKSELNKLVDEAVPKIDKIKPSDTVTALRGMFDGLCPQDHISCLKEEFDKALLGLLDGNSLERESPVSLLKELFMFNRANDKIDKIINTNKYPGSEFAYSVYLKLLFERVSLMPSDDGKRNNALANIFKNLPEYKALEFELNKLVDKTVPKISGSKPSKTVTALRGMFDGLRETFDGSCPLEGAQKQKLPLRENTQIYAVLYDDYLDSEYNPKNRCLFNHKKTPYSINYIGGLNAKYSYKIVYNNELEMNGFKIHLDWKAKDKVPDEEERKEFKNKALLYEKYEYFRLSSISKAIYQNVSAEYQKTTPRDDRRHNEHNRWYLYTCSIGCINNKLRNDRAKQHFYLVHYDKLPEEAKPKDDLPDEKNNDNEGE